MKPRFSLKVVLALAGLLAAAHSTIAADDWPLVRGDAFGTGVARGPVPDDLEVLWKYPAGKYSAGKDAGIDATAVISEGVIYVGDSAGTFHAVRLSDGSRVWTKNFADSGFGAGAAIEKGLIYVGDINGVARCLAAADGAEHWKRQLEGEVYAGPTPNGDDILFTCEAGTLSWLSKKDGQVRHTFKIEAPLRCTPTISAGHVVLAGCDSRLHVINATDGKESNTVDIDGPTGSTPSMHGERVYFGTENGTFYAIDISSSGDKKPAVTWTHKDKQRNQPIRAAAAVSEQIVVYGAQSKAIYGLVPATGDEKWKVTTRSRFESSPVIAANRVVAATATGKMYLLDAATGEVKWEYEAGGGFNASPAVVDGRIILGNTDGNLYCFGSKNSSTKRIEQEVTEKTEKK